MNGARIFLGASALLWFTYGVYCFLHPEFLAGAAGVAATSATGMTELRAMYGGLQAGIGLLAIVGMMSQAARGTVLIALAFLTGGLGSTRLIGAFLDGGWSAYTLAGIIFEWLSTALSVHFARRD